MNRFSTIINQYLSFNFKQAQPHLTSLGWVLIIAYLGFYFFNDIIAEPTGYENFTLRLLVAISGVVLWTYQYWPSVSLKYQIVTFHLILLFAFPFFFSFMLFNNQESNIWQINQLIGLVLLSFFVDWFSYLVISLLGIALAYLACCYNNHQLLIINSDLIGVFGSYSPPLIYFLIFAKKRQQLMQEQVTDFNEVKEYNKLLEHNISVTNELNIALAAKGEFLNNISHEIRTPIQGVSAISVGLVEHWNEFDEAKKYDLAKQVAKNANRLASLVGNLLDLTNLNNGKIILHKQAVDLNKLIKQMIEECNSLYQAEQARNFNFKSEFIEHQLLADEERLNQVLRNLFYNAIKFSRLNTKIIITTKLTQLSIQELADLTLTKADLIVNKPKASFVLIDITDQGVGIPKDELVEIFIPFNQSSRTKTKAGGTGLGLAIAKEIINLHEGYIWAISNQIGSSFRILLPTDLNQNLINQSVDQSNQLNQSINQAKAKQLTILIIDDEETCLNSMELILHNSNYQLIKAQGGKAGLKLLQSLEYKIDLILLDLMMPDLYGLNLLKIIKQDQNLINIPVILQTGSSDQLEINKAIRLGACAYLTKPYQKKLVIELINNHISN